MTIRELVSEKVSKQVAAASIKQHESNIETLYVNSDGDVFWDEQVSADTWLQSEDGSLTSIYQAGTGSCPCNCDACSDGYDPADWAGSCVGISDFADELQAVVDEIPEGFFADEQ
jgi:hypothetical protein